MRIHVVLIGLVLLISSAWADPPAQRSGTELLADGDKLADQAKYTEALVRYKEGYEKILPDLRGLKFKSAVEPKFMERSDLQAHMQTLFDEDMTEAELTLSDASLKAFGFVSGDFKTKDTVLNLYSEEVAGFYDPKRKQMFLIKETDKPPAQKPGLIARLLGAKTGFDKDEQKTTLSHEMTHALADQHFNLLKMQEVAEKDDDRSLALQALVEGEATLMMMVDMERSQGGTGKELLKASPAAMDFSMRLMSGLMPFASGKAFRNAPPIFRETMMFPYLKGMVFTLYLTNENEWERVNEAFRKPPVSTEQVLHPEKYLKEIDEPTEIELPPLGEKLGGDWKELGQNVLGELQISILLRKQQGQKAAAGWDGDRYAIFQGPEEKLGLVWYTTWDNEREASEFAAAYSRYLGSRLGFNDANSNRNDTAPDEIPAHLRLERQGRAYDVNLRGSDVVTIEGFTAKEADELATIVFTAEKRAKE
jgi:hypothetical protein